MHHGTCGTPAGRRQFWLRRESNACLRELTGFVSTEEEEGEEGQMGGDALTAFSDIQTSQKRGNLIFDGQYETHYRKKSQCSIYQAYEVLHKYIEI